MLQATWCSTCRHRDEPQAEVLQVKDGDKAIRYLNELEWVEGEIWANVWQTECIARINPSGSVRYIQPPGGVPLVVSGVFVDIIQAALGTTSALQVLC